MQKGVNVIRIPVVTFSPLGQQASNTVELQPGHVYRGTVAEVNPDSVLLRIGGMLVRGTGQLALELGQVLNLRAEQSDASTLLLRVIPVLESPSTQVSLEQAVRQVHVQPSPQNLAAVNALLAWLQPVDNNEVARFMAESKDLPADKQLAYLNLRGWTKAVELPEDRTTIRVVTRFLLGLAEPEDVPPALRHINEGSTPTNYPELSILWWQNRAQHGELYVFNHVGSHNAEQAQTQTLALRIQTVRLGELWLKVAYGTSELALTFYSPRQDALCLLQGVEALFGSVVSTTGFELGDVSYRLEQPNSFLDVMPLSTEPYRGINLVV